MELDYTDRARDEMLKANPPGGSRHLSGSDELHLEAIHLTLTHDLSSAIAKYEQMLKQASEAELPDAFLELGRAYQRNEELKKAIQSYEETIRRSPEYAAAFLRVGTLHARAKNAAKADAAFNQAESLYRSLSNIEGLTEVLYQRATAAESSRPKEAETLAEQAIGTAQTAGSVSQQINALMRLSSIEYKLGDAAKAQKSAASALELSQVNGLNNLTARALTLIGDAAFTHGEPALAIQYYNQALDYARRYAIPRQEMNARFMLASVMVQQGNVDEGIRQLEPALDFFQKGGYRREASQSLFIVIRGKRKQGDFAGALEAAQQESQIVRQMGDRSLLNLAEGSIGIILMELQRFPEALVHYQESYSIAKEIGARSGMAYAQANMGMLLGLMGREPEARAALQQAWALAADDKALLAELQLSLAEIAIQQRRTGEAEAAAKRALAGADSRDSDIGIGAYRILAQCAASSGRRAEAIKNAERSLELAGKSGVASDLGATLLAVAEVRMDTGDAAGAAEPASRAEQLFTRAGQIESQWRAALVMARAAAARHNDAGKNEAASRASVGLARLSSTWGREPFQSYLARPDIGQRKKILDFLVIHK